MRAINPGESRALYPLPRVIGLLVLLWLAGATLRIPILAVPPVIRLIHDDLHLTETEVGILSGLPMVLFMLAAVPGSLLIARLGALATLVVGLIVTAVASALRGAILEVWFLYLMTIVMSAGVAIMQPAMPPLVRQWLPHRIGLATAVYTNGLIVGEILPIVLTAPLVLPLVGGSWRSGLAAWALPVIAITAIVLACAPRSGPSGAALLAGRRWWPNWRDPLIWKLGLMLGAVNATYFSANGFLPDYLHHIGRADLIGDALSALNFGQLPASFLLLLAAQQVERQRWPYILFGIGSLAAVLGIVFASGGWLVFWCGFLGFAAVGTLVLMLALPPLLAPPDDVHRISAAMFTISYSWAVVVPIVSGLIWDATGIPAAAFVPMGLCALMLIALAPTISFAREPEPATQG